MLIAKLDRLARNVHFISGLMETGVPFVAADMPTATPFMLHIYAAMAEAEGIAISTRTKAALAAAKARGVKLGNPRLLPTRGGPLVRMFGIVNPLPNLAPAGTPVRRRPLSWACSAVR